MKKRTKVIKKSSVEIEPYDYSDDLYFANSVKADSLEDVSNAFTPEFQAQLDLHTMKQLYFDEPWVYIAVNAVAKKLGNLPMPVHSRVIKNGELAVQPFPKHPLNLMLESPNPWEAYYSFMMKVAIELTLMGNCVIWKLRFHNQLMIIPTEAITLHFKPNNELDYYLVNGAANSLGQTGGGFKILPEDIIHIKLPNPRSVHWGLSPWIPASRPILFERYSQEYLLNFYSKQANPSTILEMGEKTNEKQALRFLKSMELAWTGRKSQRRTLILPKGVRAQNYESTFAQQELKDHVLDNRDTIRATLNIPPHEFGTQTTGSLGTNETDAQILNFYESTILPFGGLISGSFSKSFKSSLGNRFVFKHDTSNVPVLKIDENKNADLITKLLPIFSPNELRMRLFSMPPIEGGEKLVSVSQGQGQPPQNFSLPAGKENEFQESDNQKRARQFLNKYSDWWTKRKQAGEIGDIKKLQTIYLSQLLDIFVGQAEEAIKVFRKLPITKGKKNKASENEIREALAKAFNSFAEVYTENNVKTLQSSGEAGYDLALEVPFKLPNQEEREVLRAENSEGRRETLEARSLDSFVTVNEGTTKKVLDTIAKGTEEGLSLGKIEESIFKFFDDMAQGRAQTIARTEVLTATSLGQKAAADDAASTIEGMTKMWLTAGDNRVRSFSAGDQNDHSLLDGVTIDIDEDFNMPAGGQMGYPRDPKGAAGETINCRCTLVMIPPDVVLDDNGIDFTGLDG